MAGACPASLSIAVGNAGGMGAMGALLTNPDGIRQWVTEVRAGTSGPFQLNTWIPDPDPPRDADAEARTRAFLAGWGPQVPAAAANVTRPSLEEQCDAFLEAAPAAVSSIMGLFPPELVTRFKAKRIAWFATATTLAEARRAREAGADAIIAQGFEAGGHRGSFDEAAAERQVAGLFALLPRHRRRPRRGRRADARRKRRDSGYGVPSVSRGENSSRVVERARESRARKHDADARADRQGSPGGGDKLREGGCRT
jgi:nitronate monooxygenase